MPSNKTTPTVSNTPTPRRKASTHSNKAKSSHASSVAATPRSARDSATNAAKVLSPRTSTASQQPWKKIQHKSSGVSTPVESTTPRIVEPPVKAQVVSAANTEGSAPTSARNAKKERRPSQQGSSSTLPASKPKQSPRSMKHGAHDDHPTAEHTVEPLTKTKKSPSSSPSPRQGSSPSVSPRSGQTGKPELPFSPPRRGQYSVGREASPLGQLSESDKAVAAGLYRVLLPNTMMDSLQGLLDETHFALFGDQPQDGNHSALSSAAADEMHQLLMSMSATLASEGARLHEERKARLKAGGVPVAGEGDGGSRLVSARGGPAGNSAPLASWRSPTPADHTTTTNTSFHTTTSHSPSAAPIRIVTRASIVAETAHLHDRAIPYSYHSPNGNSYYSPNSTVRSAKGGASPSLGNTLRGGSPSLSSTRRSNVSPKAKKSESNPSKKGAKKATQKQKVAEPTPSTTIPTATTSPSPNRPISKNGPSGTKSMTAALAGSPDVWPRRSVSNGKERAPVVDVPVRNNSASSQQLAWGRLVAAVEAQTAVYSDPNALLLSATSAPDAVGGNKSTSPLLSKANALQAPAPSALLSRDDLKLLSLPTIQKLAGHYVKCGRLRETDVGEIAGYWARAHRQQ